jgi:hypothetical protein
VDLIVATLFGLLMPIAPSHRGRSAHLAARHVDLERGSPARSGGEIPHMVGRTVARPSVRIAIQNNHN